MKGMTIPNDISELDLIDLLPENISGSFIRMSYNLAAVVHLWPTVFLLQYTWPDEDPYSAVSRNTTMKEEIITGDLRLQIDPSSGQILLSGDSHCKQYILEPSLVQNTR